MCRNVKKIALPADVVQRIASYARRKRKPPPRKKNSALDSGKSSAEAQNLDKHFTNHIVPRSTTIAKCLADLIAQARRRWQATGDVRHQAILDSLMTLAGGEQ